MPATRVVLFRESDGSVPLLEWFDRLPSRARAKCIVSIERLRQQGHELRRPEADYLRDGIYELRVRYQSVNYRLLYFFHRRVAAIVSHGLPKERVVPPKEIELAVKRSRAFAANPQSHTYEE